MVSTDLYYVRIKNFTSTIFVDCSAEDSIAALKGKISKALRNGKDPKDMQLILPSTTSNPSDSKVLDDEAQLHQLGIANDQILHLVYWVPGENSPADGKWETVNIPPYAPLGEGEEVEPATVQETDEAPKKATTSEESAME